MTGDFAVRGSGLEGLADFSERKLEPFLDDIQHVLMFQIRTFQLFGQIWEQEINRVTKGDVVHHPEASNPGEVVFPGNMEEFF
jgi:hypothetical protein